jgi:hypothetical protein
MQAYLSEMLQAAKPLPVPAGTNSKFPTPQILQGRLRLACLSQASTALQRPLAYPPTQQIAHAHHLLSDGRCTCTGNDIHTSPRKGPRTLALWGPAHLSCSVHKVSQCSPPTRMAPGGCKEGMLCCAHILLCSSLCCACSYPCSYTPCAHNPMQLNCSRSCLRLWQQR